MLIDVTLPLTEKIIDEKVIHLKKEPFTGHVGTIAPPRT